jgi:metallo-beta-lactamase family protein
MVVLAGFQAEGTRGRLLADGAAAVKLLGREVPVRAEILQIEAFSSHADADEMTGWLAGMAKAPANTYLVHGEPAGSVGLQRLIGERLGWSSSIPDPQERVTIS